jgi:hypothetical protein
MQKEIYCSQCGKKHPESATTCPICKRSLWIANDYFQPIMPSVETQKRIVLNFLLKRFIPLFLIIFALMLGSSIALMIHSGLHFEAKLRQQMMEQMSIQPGVSNE